MNHQHEDSPPAPPQATAPLDGQAPFYSVLQHLRAIELCLAVREWELAIKLLFSYIDMLTWLWLPPSRHRADPATQRAWCQHFLADNGYTDCTPDDLCTAIERHRSGPPGMASLGDRPLVLFSFDSDRVSQVEAASRAAGLGQPVIVPFQRLLVALSGAAVRFFEQAERDRSGWERICQRAGRFQVVDEGLDQAIAGLQQVAAELAACQLPQHAPGSSPAAMDVQAGQSVVDRMR